MRTKTQNIKAIVNNNKDGFTIDFNLKHAKHKSGFYVGITNNNGANITKLYNRLLELKKNYFKFSKNMYIGGWKDNKNFYLDLSLFIKNKNEALQIAKAFNQKAIFDIKNLNNVIVK